MKWNAFFEWSTLVWMRQRQRFKSAKNDRDRFTPEFWLIHIYKYIQIHTQTNKEKKVPCRRLHCSGLHWSYWLCREQNTTHMHLYTYTHVHIGRFVWVIKWANRNDRTKQNTRERQTKWEPRFLVHTGVVWSMCCTHKTISWLVVFNSKLSRRRSTQKEKK